MANILQLLSCGRGKKAAKKEAKKPGEAPFLPACLPLKADLEIREKEVREREWQEGALAIGRGENTRPDQEGEEQGQEDSVLGTEVGSGAVAGKVKEDAFLVLHEPTISWKKGGNQTPKSQACSTAHQ